MSTIAVPSLGPQVAQHVEDPGLDGHVQRGGRLVGDQQLRVGRPAPSRSSPAAACRRRAGAGTRAAAAAGQRDADQLEQLDRPRPARPRRACPRCRRSTSPIWRPDGEHRVQRGHRLLEDVGDLRGRGCRAARASGSSSSVAALEPDASRRCVAVRGSSRVSDIAVTLLPQPDSPTSAEHLAGARRRTTTSSTASTGPSSVRRQRTRQVVRDGSSSVALVTASRAGRGRRAGRRRAG